MCGLALDYECSKSSTNDEMSPYHVTMLGGFTISIQ